MRQIALLSLLLLSLKCYSQENADGSYTVAVVPVTSVVSGGERYIQPVQDVIAEAFAGKNRFTVVDRSKLEQLAKERNLQKQEDFIKSESTVEQGMSTGAQYLISGNIASIGKQSGYLEKSKLDYDANSKQFYTRKYQVFAMTIDMTINVQVIDVATGNVKSTKAFARSVQTETSSESEAVNNTIKSFRPYLKGWINSTFPIYMKVIRVESTTRKGLPEKVLIKGGEEMDLTVNKGFLQNNSSELDVFVFEILTVDGKEFKRQVTIGKVRIDEVQGEFSVCKVRSGAEEIQKQLNDGKTLLLKIAHY